MKAKDAKVAWVTPRLGRNGNLLYMEPLLKGISKACKELHVFTVEFGEDCSHPDFGITCEGSIKLVNQSVTSHGAPTGIPLISPAIIRKLYRYKPDLLMLNEFGLLTVYGILLSFILRRAKILLIVENRPVTNGSPMYRRIRKFVRRLIARRANALLTNNIDGKSYLVQELGVGEDKIISRPYLTSDMSQYLNIPEYSGPDNKTRDNSNPIRFIYAGRLIPSKGLDHALEAFHFVMQKHPGRFLFDIVGDGPDRSLLNNQVQQLGLQDHVRFHGQQPYHGLAALYQRADVFLFPTLVDYRSLVGFEAMSVGLPILASIHDGGSVETVKEGENGFTFDPLDHRGLADILSRFIEQPELIEAFSAKSRVMSESYTLPRAVESGVLAINLALATS